MTKRILKMVAIIMVGVMGFTFSGSSIAFAYYNYYGYNYYDYGRYYRHHHSRWSSRDTWGLVGIGVLAGLFAIFNKPDKPYSEKKAKKIAEFNQLENQIYSLISSDPRGNLGLLQFSSEEELKLIKRVFKAVYGEYCILNVLPYKDKYVAIYLKFTCTYESKKITGLKYEDFVARQIMAILPSGMEFYIEYDKDLFESLVKIGANCYRDNSQIILRK